VSRCHPRSLTAAVLLSVLALTGCAAQPSQPRRPAPPQHPVPPAPDPVAVQPSEACGVLGWGNLPSQFPGSTLASRIDEEDCRRAWVARQAALGRATPSHEPIYWADDKTANYGSFTPTTDTPPKGPVCRQYEQMLVIDGASTRTTAWACLQHDGSWKLAGSLS
jgi:surface antigen